MHRGLSKEKVEKMKEMRRRGSSYRKITEKLNVSKWACQKYLIDIEVDKSWIEEKWKAAQDEAGRLLEEKGYENILDLNKISPSSHWDYYCTKNDERWLIDVTINSSKNLVDKALRRLEGFEHAVLLKENGKWTMLKINIEKV